jgi:hypothetical protein
LFSLSLVWRSWENLNVHNYLVLECFLSISLRCQILHGPRFKLAYTQCHCFAILADCANLIISCYCITAVLGYQYYMKDYMCLLCNSVPPTRSYLAARNEGCTHCLWETEAAKFYFHDYRIIYFASWGFSDLRARRNTCLVLMQDTFVY